MKKSGKKLITQNVIKNQIELAVFQLHYFRTSFNKCNLNLYHQI